MNFEFSDEQESLRDQARRLFANAPAKARMLLEADAGHDAELWSHAAGMGLTAAAIAERQGGLGLGALELCVVAEEIGRSLAPIPFSSSVLVATEALKLAGGAAADEWLPRLAAGEVIATLAFTEGSGVWSTAPRGRVRDGRFDGIKTPVADAASAQIAIVSARSDEDGDGYGWWLLPLQGVAQMPVTAIDRIRKHAALNFVGTPAQRIGSPGSGATLTERLLDIAAVYVAFEQLGGAEAMLAMSVDYAKRRRAFGNAIGATQAVKHRLADMYTKVQLARGHCLYGAWALSTAAPELPLAAAGARLAASDAFCYAAEEGIEIHGGIGFTWENDCTLYLRRSRLLAQMLGHRSRWSDRLVRALIAGRAA
ncbi:MAG: acyl-CoA dehydrogenase domain protein [Hydrocarboniphaga sp.]|uniref:acyl-CoA dehydrogenase family protein n=1 Tax=Hydrocarboniphaga sp. TaxID=2033016 RepID=UPI0026224FF3|nr:acyl-CoA dehydrogenase family protein [Hydrocarboniphaga sp.]MDB5969907.1 acyl-CoA dehydrogenase domain protein [Hydrocarboniphaga sp.]